MFLLNVKTMCLVIPCSFSSRVFTMAFAQQQDSLPVLPQNPVEAENDFNMILLGMRNYDGAALSGEGECLYVFRHPGTPDAHSTWKARLTFDPTAYTESNLKRFCQRDTNAESNAHFIAKRHFGDNGR